jgi:hypothetical protein
VSPVAFVITREGGRSNIPRRFGSISSTAITGCPASAGHDEKSKKIQENL